MRVRREDTGMGFERLYVAHGRCLIKCQTGPLCMSSRRVFTFKREAIIQPTEKRTDNELGFHVFETYSAHTPVGASLDDLSAIAKHRVFLYQNDSSKPIIAHANCSSRSQRSVMNHWWSQICYLPGALTKSIHCYFCFWNFFGIRQLPAILMSSKPYAPSISWIEFFLIIILALKE